MELCTNYAVSYMESIVNYMESHKNHFTQFRKPDIKEIKSKSKRNYTGNKMTKLLWTDFNLKS